jgi:hypothetical protein
VEERLLLLTKVAAVTVNQQLRQIPALLIQAVGAVVVDIVLLQSVMVATAAPALLSSSTP